MLKIENTETYGWKAAFRGMRNPMNSWGRSDSVFCSPDGCSFCEYEERCSPQLNFKVFGDDHDLVDFAIGDNDMKLAKSLCKGGSVHSKFMRFITVTADVCAPLYWYKEFDTYKIGTVANSCSTMHKIHSRDLELDDFSHEHLNPMMLKHLEDGIHLMNLCRQQFVLSGDKEMWWQMIQSLPASYNQRRTIQLNYEVLKNIYHSRKDHKLDEWHTFCDWIKELPYAKELIIGEEA